MKSNKIQTFAPLTLTKSKNQPDNGGGAENYSVSEHTKEIRERNKLSINQLINNQKVSTSILDIKNPENPEIENS